MVRYREGNGSAVTREISIFGDADDKAKANAADALTVIKAELEKAKPSPPAAPAKPDSK
jgi:anaerobic ribonucleoside-triphosphate reductase